LLGGFTYQGGMTINTGAGADSVNVTNGTVQGSINILTGLGNDTVSLGDGEGGLIAQQTVQVSDTYGTNTLHLAGGGALEVGTTQNPRDLSITGFANVDQAGNFAILIHGNLTINNSTTTNNNEVTLNAAAPVTVEKNLSITTGTG